MLMNGTPQLRERKFLSVCLPYPKETKEMTGTLHCGHVNDWGNIDPPFKLVGNKLHFMCRELLRQRPHPELHPLLLIIGSSKS
jgi:hypothetical protein